MRIIHDARSGDEYQLLEPGDLDNYVSTLIRGFGAWIVGTGLALAVGGTLLYSALRHDVDDNARDIGRLQQVDEKQADRLDSLRNQVRDVPRRTAEELQNLQGRTRR